MRSKLQSFLKYAFVFAFSLVAVQVVAQDEGEELVISGSVDTYYTYDFSGFDNNIKTSFANQRNSLAIGMVDLMFSKTVGKASFVGEVAFGPRASVSNFAFPVGTAPGDIQNLYVSYAFSDQVSATAGFMGTFVGYEVISPAVNFNYSGSYLFSNGPFQNAGVKINYTPSESFGIMVGAFQSAWDSYTGALAPGRQTSLGVSELGVQVFFAPFDGGSVYLNYIGGTLNQEVDLTASFQLTDEFFLGLNVANRLKANGSDKENFFGGAAYLQYAFSETFALGARYEYFSVGKESTFYSFPGAVDSNGKPVTASVNAITLSGNINLGPLRVIPELRYDAASEKIFQDAADDALTPVVEGKPTNSAIQMTIAAVYAF